MKRLAPLVLLLLLVPSHAFADITAFIGVTPTPVSRPARGFSVGMGLVIVGFEFEYSNTNDDLDVGEVAPRLKTYMGNGLLQTPFPIAGMQFYATAGGGVYQESFGDASRETQFGANVGGGVKVNLVGPLRLRLDYRVFTLQGSPRYDKPQRFYAGINLKF
jgi:opacity protein-like surface antigen